MTLRKLVLLGAAVGVTAIALGCHGDRSSPPPPPKATSTSLDTAQVLLLAQQRSETSTPFAVNGGVITLNDTSETTAPIPVKGM